MEQNVFDLLQELYKKNHRSTTENDWYYAAQTVVSIGITDKEILDEVIPWLEHKFESLRQHKQPVYYIPLPERLFSLVPFPWKEKSLDESNSRLWSTLPAF